LPWLVVSIYSKLSSGSIQPALLEPAVVPTAGIRASLKG